MQADLEAFGVPPEQAQTALAELDERPFEIFPENWEALTIFLACRTQWRFGHQGAAAGIDYPSLAMLLRLYRVKDRRDVFERVQIMEGAVLEILESKSQ